MCMYLGNLTNECLNKTPILSIYITMYKNTHICTVQISIHVPEPILGPYIHTGKQELVLPEGYMKHFIRTISCCL